LIKEKKIPLRQCLGCREMKPKNELIRAVKSPDDKVSLDFSFKAPGRGAYMCRDINCFNRVIKTNALKRAFKVQISEDIIGELRNKFENKESINGS